MVQVVTATMVVCGEPSCAEWEVQALSGLQFPSHQNHVAQIWVSIAPLLAVDLPTRLSAVDGADTSDATARRLQAGQQLLQGVRRPSTTSTTATQPHLQHNHNCNTITTATQPQLQHNHNNRCCGLLACCSVTTHNHDLCDCVMQLPSAAFPGLLLCDNASLCVCAVQLPSAAIAGLLGCAKLPLCVCMHV